MSIPDRRKRLEAIINRLIFAADDIRSVSLNLRPFPPGEWNDPRLIEVLSSLEKIAEDFEAIIDDEGK